MLYETLSQKTKSSKQKNPKDLSLVAPEIKSAWIIQQAQGLLGQFSDTLQQNKVRKAKTNKTKHSGINQDIRPIASTDNIKSMIQLPVLQKKKGGGRDEEEKTNFCG